MQNVIHVEDGMIYGGFGGVNSTPSLPIKSIKNTVEHALFVDRTETGGEEYTPMYTVLKDSYAVMRVSMTCSGNVSYAGIYLAGSESTDPKTEHENKRTIALSYEAASLNANNSRRDVEVSVFLPAGSKIYGYTWLRSSGYATLDVSLYEVARES